MNLFELLGMVSRTQLQAKMTPEYAAEFKRFQTLSNATRFTTQSAVLIVMDFFSLIAFSVYYMQIGSFLPYNIFVHIFKILANTAMLIYNLHLYAHPKKADAFFNRNADFLYPFTHCVLEFMLFASGPQGIGSLVRFLAVPFIAASIPILEQKRSFVLQSIVYLVFSTYLLGFTPYGVDHVEGHFVVFVNIVLVVFVCSNLVSNIVYSSSVTNYIHKKTEEKIKFQLDSFNKELEVMSRHDKLTGLSNRRDFDEYIESTWQKAAEKSLPVHALIMDIDHFKSFNDRYGHLKGDSCLVTVTQKISNCLEMSDYMFARYGGEEFVFITTDKGHQQMVLLAEKIRKAIQELKVDNPDSTIYPFVTISIGVATLVPAVGTSSDILVKLADECLYQAKQNGRNRVVQVGSKGEKYQNIHGVPLLEEKKVLLQENEMFSNETEFEHAINEMDIDSTFLYIREKNCVEFSENMANEFGFPRNLLNPTVQKCASYFAEESRNQFIRIVNGTLADRNRDFSGKLLMNAKNGQKSWYYLRGTCSYNGQGQASVISGSIMRIEDILGYFRYIGQQQMVSNITMLPNRKRFYNDMQEVLKQGNEGYIVLFDISNFKAINGVYSHNIGDKVLFKVGNTLEKLVSEVATLYQYALDQYILFIDKCTKEDVVDLVQLIRQYFAQNDIDFERDSIKITFNIGIVAYDKAMQSLDELMVDMDITIQKVKYNYEGEYSFFDKKDRVSYLENVHLESQLKYACQNSLQGFAIHYQPINDSNTMACIGAEALLRWYDSEGNIISPALLIPILEDTGLMVEVEQWIFEEATAQCRQWINQGAREDFFIHINLSPTLISRPTLVEELMYNIRKNSLNPYNIVLEVTESALISEMHLSIQILNELRALGISIAVDDFGTGYSSLSYLRSLPIDEIKVDQSFLHNSLEGESEKRLLFAIIAMCESMGYSVCLEGVETEEEVQMLADTKLSYLQGYYFSQPLPANEFTDKFIV